jgi:hypothetical protein
MSDVTYGTGRCLRCSIVPTDPEERLVADNGHALNAIPSTEESEALARAYQKKLWDNMKSAVDRKLDEDETTGQFMVGALIATYEAAADAKTAGVTQKFLAVSGKQRNTGRARHAAHQLDALFAAENGCTPGNQGGYFALDLFNQKVRIKTGVLTGEELVRLGLCAAPKLLRKLIEFTTEKKYRISKLALTEIMVIARNIPGAQRNKEYGDVQVAPSCPTCQVLLPQILCNRCKVDTSRNTRHAGIFHPNILAHQAVEKL